MSISRALLLIVSVCTISACSLKDYHHTIELTSLNNPAQAQARLSHLTPSYQATDKYNYEKDLAAFATLQRQYRTRVSALWGNGAEQFSSPSRYIKYTNDYRSRAIIDFQAGTVEVATQVQDNSLQHLKQAIEYTLLAPDAPNFIDFYTSYASQIKSTPFLYRQVRDQDGKLIKWHWRAARFAGYLLKNNLQESEYNGKQIHSVSFAMTADHNQVRMQRYQGPLQQLAQQHAIDANIVNAIIQTETGFNPYAISADGRIGLMQISADRIGTTVFNQQQDQPFAPLPCYLFKITNNLDLGISYLQLVNNRYFAGITDANSRYYALLASYHAGPEQTLQVFSRDKSEAIALINSLSSYEVYQSLTGKQAQPEIQAYVYQANHHFRSLSD